jgi:heavy metal-binding protein
VARRSPILNQPRRLAPLAVLAAGLAVLAVVYRGELAGWIVGDRNATGISHDPVAFYTCPMDPSVESDHPGPCPICGMALTPVSKDDRASGVVRVAAAARARLGVIVAPVETRPLIKRVVAAGEVIASPPAAADRASIAARVYRGDAREVRPGQPVDVSVLESPLTQFAGSVEPPRPTDAPGELRLVVDDPGHVLQPGMRVEAQLEVALSPRLVVPAEAVVYAGPTRIVFVEHGSGRFEPRTPKLGATAAGLVEVIDGLAAGDHVVVKGTFLLAAESRLRSDGSLWGDLAKPAPIKRAAPAPAPTSAYRVP